MCLLRAKNRRKNEWGNWSFVSLIIYFIHLSSLLFPFVISHDSYLQAQWQNQEYIQFTAQFQKTVLKDMAAGVRMAALSEPQLNLCILQGTCEALKINPQVACSTMSSTVCLPQSSCHTLLWCCVLHPSQHMSCQLHWKNPGLTSPQAAQTVQKNYTFFFIIVCVHVPLYSWAAPKQPWL